MFGVSEVDAIDGEDGVSHKQLVALFGRQIGVDLADEDRHPMFFAPRDGDAQPFGRLPSQLHYANVPYATPLSVYTLKQKQFNSSTNESRILMWKSALLTPDRH